MPQEREKKSVCFGVLAAWKLLPPTGCYCPHQVDSGSWHLFSAKYSLKLTFGLVTAKCKEFSMLSFYRENEIAALSFVFKMGIFWQLQCWSPL
jgi:hypothetical protein